MTVTTSPIGTISRHHYLVSARFVSEAYELKYHAAPQRRRELEERKGTAAPDTGDLDVPYTHSLSVVRCAGWDRRLNMEWSERERRGLAKVRMDSAQDMVMVTRSRH